MGRVTASAPVAGTDVASGAQGTAAGDGAQGTVVPPGGTQGSAGRSSEFSRRLVEFCVVQMGIVTLWSRRLLLGARLSP